MGEIQFFPNGHATDNPSKKTEILYIGIKAIEEYINEIKSNESVKYDFIYGRSDHQIASVTKRIGFTTVDNGSGSIVMYTTPKEIIDAYNKLQTEGVIEKINMRYQNYKE